MKKKSALVLAAVVAMSALTGCGSDNNAASSGGDKTNTSEAPEVTTSITETAQTTTSAAQTTTTISETEAAPIEEQEAVEEEIVPLEISPQSIPRVTPKISEFACISTLIYYSANQMYLYDYIPLWFNDCSTLDSPLPTSTFIASWGCYPEVIVSTIESHISSESTQPSDVVVATNLTGISPNDLYQYIENGTPVMVWVTKRLFNGEVLLESEGITLNSHHECAILVGYSDTQVMIWSPFQDDYVTYDRTMFEECFENEGSFALTITKK